MKLDLPDTVAEATEEYRRRDWLTNFINERCVRDPYAREGARTLYIAYKEWAQEGGEFVRRENDFAEAMAKAGFLKITPKNKSTWQGVRIDRGTEFAGSYNAGA